MTSATTGSAQPVLGVLEGAAFDEARCERALMALQELGLSRPTPEMGKAVAVALSHATYRYEYPAAFPGVTEGLLDALSALGLAFLRRQAALNAYKRTVSATPGPLSKEVAQVVFALPTWADRQ